MSKPVDTHARAGECPPGGRRVRAATHPNCKSSSWDDRTRIYSWSFEVSFWRAVYELCIDKLFEPDSMPLGWQKRAQLFVKAAEVAGLSDLISGEDGR